MAARLSKQRLSKSVCKNFNGTGLISSMEQCNDFFLLGTEHISIGRVGLVRNIKLNRHFFLSNLIMLNTQKIYMQKDMFNELNIFGVCDDFWFQDPNGDPNGIY